MRSITRSPVSVISLLLVLAAGGCGREDTPLSTAGNSSPPLEREAANDPYPYLLMPETVVNHPTPVWQGMPGGGGALCNYADTFSHYLCEGTWNLSSYDNHILSPAGVGDIWFAVTDLEEESTTTRISPRIGLELGGGATLSVQLWFGNDTSGQMVYSTTISCPGSPECAPQQKFVWAPASLTGISLSKAQVNNLRVRFYNVGGTTRVHSFELELQYQLTGGGGGGCRDCELD